jgi:hypothetical protein
MPSPHAQISQRTFWYYLLFFFTHDPYLSGPYLHSVPRPSFAHNCNCLLPCYTFKQQPSGHHYGETSFLSSSGRQKTCSHQNDIVWTLFDPLSTTFIHFWVILISWRVKNLKSSLWFEKDRGPKIKFKWPSIQSFTAL